LERRAGGEPCLQCAERERKAAEQKPADRPPDYVLPTNCPRCGRLFEVHVFVINGKGHRAA